MIDYKDDPPIGHTADGVKIEIGMTLWHVNSVLADTDEPLPPVLSLSKISSNPVLQADDGPAEIHRRLTYFDRYKAIEVYIAQARAKIEKAEADLAELCATHQCLQKPVVPTCVEHHKALVSISQHVQGAGYSNIERIRLDVWYAEMCLHLMEHKPLQPFVPLSEKVYQPNKEDKILTPDEVLRKLVDDRLRGTDWWHAVRLTNTMITVFADGAAPKKFPTSWYGRSCSLRCNADPAATAALMDSRSSGESIRWTWNPGKPKS